MSFFNNTSDYYFPKSNDLNVWADYVEFFALISEDNSRTLDQLKDRLLDQVQHDYKEALRYIILSRSSTGKIILSRQGLIEVEDEVQKDQIEVEGSDYDDVLPSQNNNIGKEEDELNSEFYFLFSFLASRSKLFGACYPFKIDIRRNKISQESSSLSDPQKIYVSLLLSSILSVFSESNRNKIGHLFEKLCYYPFLKMLPPSSQIGFFGSGVSISNVVQFTGTFAERINKLSELIKTDTTTLFKQNLHDYGHVGDGGLDWVAWTLFPDEQSKLPIFFGQCACGNNWIDKEWDAHYDKFSNFLQFNDVYMLFHFVSKSFRKEDGEWYVPGNIYKVILVDRLRILGMIDQTNVTNICSIYEELFNEVNQFVLEEGD